MDQSAQTEERVSPEKDVPTLIYQKVGERFLAILFDSLLLLIILIILNSFLGTDGASCNSSFWIGATVNMNGSAKFYGLCGMPALIYFFLGFAYFVIFEWLFGGTIGKRALGMRVRTIDGMRIGIGASLIRNLMRLIDILPVIAPYLVGAIAIWTSDTKQRLGDRVAKTVVVKHRSILIRDPGMDD